jgi:hypothetical protein
LNFEFRRFENFEKRRWIWSGVRRRREDLGDSDRGGLRKGLGCQVRSQAQYGETVGSYTSAKGVGSEGIVNESVNGCGFIKTSTLFWEF